MAIVVGCKCDCPIVGYREIDTPAGKIFMPETTGLPVKAHKENCHHRKHALTAVAAVS